MPEFKNPDCQQEQRQKYLLGRIKQFWLESVGIYGYRKIFSDFREEGKSCVINLIHRLMKRKFNPTAPNKSWVTDITYIKTHEGWLHLAVVIDLFSRLVIVVDQESDNLRVGVRCVADGDLALFPKRESTFTF
ncbi:hypothetical protein ATN88_16115 [Enterovibrio coralii]|uniref:Integrase catalytic domain-containing protein n=1 Tax=Enterovibrio coralii TaxID=294935 RepID=A0A135I5S5_9GAMM|nr:hypothetical protein ATN88_16115 [Enterovibrio coralii]